MAPRIRVGITVRVVECSGIDSNKIGTVIPRQSVPTNGRGVPVLPGHYKPLTVRESVIRTTSGEVITMFNNRLQVVQSA